MMMKLATLTFCLLLAACAAEKRAPLPGDSVVDGSVNLNPGRVPTTPKPSSTPAALSALESKLYPAELIMEHQAEISLTAPQRDAIAKELDRSHSELLKLQWELDAEKEKLVATLDPAKVDEQAAKAAAGEVTKREDAIKLGHLGSLIRIKNTLQKEQHAKLDAIRQAERCPPK